MIKAGEVYAEVKVNSEEFEKSIEIIDFLKEQTIEAARIKFTAEENYREKYLSAFTAPKHVIIIATDRVLREIRKTLLETLRGSISYQVNRIWNYDFAIELMTPDINKLRGIDREIPVLIHAAVPVIGEYIHIMDLIRGRFVTVKSFSYENLWEELNVE